MLSRLKRLLYFPIASYFRFFAVLRLRRWNPRIVVVTGSNGKTTLLHMLEAQLGAKARYSHHANSSFGIPFCLFVMCGIVMYFYFVLCILFFAGLPLLPTPTTPLLVRVGDTIFNKLASKAIDNCPLSLGQLHTSFSF